MGNLLDCSVGGDLPPGGSGDETTDAAGGAGGGGVTELQAPTRLKDSLLWDLQRSFYDEVAIGAWSEAIVPNFVTTNAFLASAYAKSIMGLIRDLFDSPSAPGDRAKPLYIVEVGAGHGKLGFLICRELLRMREFFPAGHGLEFPFKYVMTDFTAHNVEFWMQHASFAELFEMGVLDCAVWDAEKETSMTLLRSKEVLSADSGLVTNPLVVITNYIFDTLRTDAFRIVDGELQETRIAIDSSSAADAEEPTAPSVIKRMSHRWSYEAVPADADFFGDEDFNYVVRSYAERLENASFMVPVGGLSLIRSLSAMSGGRLLLLTGDKGYVREAELEGHRDPHIAVHGSFSVMVNFHALRLYVERLGGFAMTTPHLDGFKCAHFFLGLPREATMHTRWAFKNNIEEFGPENFSTLQRCIKEECTNPSLKHVLALLRLSRHDSEVFYKFKQVLIDKTMYPYAADNVQRDIREDIAGVEETYYPLQSSKDVCFEIGRLLMGLKDYRGAVGYFERSNELCGQHHVTYHNMGICCYYLDEFETALKCFDASLDLKPDYGEAADWRKKLLAKTQSASSGHAWNSEEDYEDGTDTE